ncbi:hypothetical protein KIW84_064500 [Lathyrus oleraceus]|uniref:Uncharacterized protein n=1 Tax=Pisum sativum TaxID=3888 RepID=A0A9D5AB53_PEA|nr:hypothetical protein KIW84_064500 [Pisum sativum]
MAMTTTTTQPTAFTQEYSLPIELDSQAWYREVLLEGFLESNGLYYFPNLTLNKASSLSTSFINSSETTLTSLPVTNTDVSLSPSIHRLQPSYPPPQNDHPMLTREKTEHSKPKVFIAHTEPTSVKQALLKLEWVHAMKSEYDALMANHKCYSIEH